MKETEGVMKGRKKVVTPVCLASYAFLLEPVKSLNDEMKYSISMIFSKDCDLSDMKKAAANALIDKWGADKEKWPKSLRSPFRDGDEKEDPLYQGNIFVNASSVDPPQIGEKIGGKFSPLMKNDEVYSGMFCRVSLTAFAYDKKGNRGVSFALNNVLKVRDGKRLDGRTDGDTDFKDFDDTRTFDEAAKDAETPTGTQDAAEDLFA